LGGPTYQSPAIPAPTVMPCCQPQPVSPAAGLPALVHGSGITERIFEFPDEFGGKPWYDPDGKFLLHIPYVGDLASAQGRLESVIPAELPVEWEAVKYSETQLEAVVRDMPNAWLNAIVSFSIDSRMNWVVIAFADADQPEMRQQIFEAYGDRVVFTVEPRTLPL
ncbi:MAG: hypothetical protein QFC55_06825, partial [Chloroflexota bacterium]|nr:hypothetical protein [Chloroflexota bacterium]